MRRLCATSVGVVVFAATFASTSSLADEGLTHIGELTSGVATGCVGNTLTFLGLSTTLSEAGWDISIGLPLPTNGDQAFLAILDARWNVTQSGSSCLYEGKMTGSLNAAGSMLTLSAADNSLTLAPGSPFLCQLGGDATLEGTMSVGAALTVTLT